jgi:tetratricopeptide (TPR) repeat protein
MELIEHYLDGKLDSTSRISFEEQLKHDVKLRNLLQFEKDIRNIISDEDALNFRKKLNRIQEERKESTSKQSKVIPFRKLIIRVAATLTILIGLSSVWYLIDNANLSNNEAFNKYYSAHQSENFRSLESKKPMLASAMNLYQNGEYLSAIESFDYILEAEPSNIAIQFYKGIALVETGSIDNAISQFQSIIDASDNLYKEHAHWYLAMAYLKKDDTEAAIYKLTEIVNSDDIYYKEKATTILKKLHRNK